MQNVIDNLFALYQTTKLFNYKKGGKKMIDLRRVKDAIEKGKKYILEYSKYLNEIDLDKSELTIVAGALQQYMESEELWEEVFK